MPRYENRNDARAALERMLEDYHRTLPGNPRDNPLLEAINASPKLRKDLVDAVQEGYLEKFENTLPPRGAGGGYSAADKSIVLHHSKLGSKHDLVFVLGHETRHALSLKGERSHHDELVHDVGQVAASKQLPHDYTQAVWKYVDAVRAEEARAHIGGFNALHSELLRENGSVSLKEMYDAEPFRMRDFITRSGKWPFYDYEIRPGLTLEENNTLAESEGNIEQMKRYYADKMPGTFGPNGLLNYRHEAILEGWNQAHNAEVQAIGIASRQDPRNEPSVLLTEREQTGDRFLYHGQDREYLLDFDHLGVNRGLLRAPQDNRVQAIDMNAEFWRKSKDNDDRLLPSPSKQEMLGIVAATLPKNSGVVDRGQALNALGLVEVPRPVSFMDSFKALFKIEENPGNTVPEPQPQTSPLLDRAYEAVKDIGPTIGIHDPEALRNIAAGLALKAHNEGMVSIDHVFRNGTGDGLIAVQGQDPQAPESRRTTIDIAEAARQPAEESLTRLRDVVAQTPEPERSPQTRGLSA
jgi:hypothetical protein